VTCFFVAIPGSHGVWRLVAVSHARPEASPHADGSFSSSP
jgi:hypothetical protein